MRVHVFIAAAAVAAGPAGARERVQGNGEPTTERRDVGAFTRVTLESIADVTVKVGPARSVAVTIDSNLQKHLETRVEGGTLVIDARSSIRPRKVPKVEITVPELRGFTLAGSGDVRIEGGQGPVSLVLAGAGDLRWKGEATELEAELDGSGNLVLAGRADRIDARITGSGNVDARALTARSADAAVDGSGDVELHLDGGTLNAAVSGSGDVRWSGSASVASTAISGSGRVARRE